MSSEFPDTSDRDKSQQAPDPGRLRITHLLVWTTLCGVVMGLRLAWIRANVPSELITTPFLLFQVFISIIHGAAFAGVVLLIWRWSHGSRTFPTQPGHWLLLFVAACVVDDYLAEVLTKPAVTQTRRFFPAAVIGPWISQLAITCALGAVTNLVFLAIMRRAHLWRLVLVLTCLTFCAYASLLMLIIAGEAPYNDSTLRLGFYIAMVGCMLALLPLLLAAWGDRRRRTHRDWFHWAGVCTLGTALVTCIADQIRLLKF